MKKSIKTGITAFSLIIIMVLIFTGLLVISNFIPNDWLHPNIKYSAGQVAEYQTADETVPQMYDQYKMDYYTDSVMLNTAYYTDAEHPLKAAIACNMHGGGVEDLGDIAANSETSANISYSRYWHGYLIVLRPLLLVFDYIEIGVFNTYVFFGLLAYVLLMLYKKTGGWFAAAFLFTIVSLNVLVLPINLQLMTDFVISFVAMLVVARLAEKKPEWMKYAFLLIGMVTMYFDFYTYPIMTFGFPMITLLLINRKAEGTSANPVLTVLTCFGFWALGYGAAWLAKVGLVSLVLGKEEAAIAGASFASRIARTVPDSVFQKLAEGLSAIAPGISVSNLPMWLISLALVAMPLMQPVFLVGLTVWALVLVTLLIFAKRKPSGTKTGIAMLMVSALPVLWYIVAVNPTIIHFYFQYRGIGVTLFGVLSALIAGINFERLRRKRI